ncbi:MAG TPA: hypothetical protein PK624_09015 [Spirochaetota bacterium]|nr:hypothetical protein [Spirochaetota bacterium]HOR44922.1 hypothetical protein [Spirochaetota bacterium]HPK56477.1 hypothetical protein [Spirochaetota bacterium]
MNKKETCYYCGENATSSEHVPPKCIFPEFKDLNYNYRKNLITVPSCNKHNMLKSQDDEYLLRILTAGHKPNNIGVDHFSTKVMRAFQHSPDRFSKFMINPKQILVKQNDQLFESLVFYVDINRYHLILKYVAKGLFFYDYSRMFSGEILILYNGLLHKSDNSKNELYNDIDNGIKALLKDVPYKGENKDVFKYKFLQSDNTYILRYEFYDYFGITIKMAE